MQHGTAREYVTEAVENTLAVLERQDWPTADVERALRGALGALEPDAPWGFDEPGVFGEDYGRLRGPVGSTRDTRPEGLGR